MGLHYGKLDKPSHSIYRQVVFFILHSLVMKILFSIGSLNGGGMERVMSVLATQLAERGHDIIICLNRNIVGYPIRDKVKLIYSTNSNQADKYGKIGRLFCHIYNKFLYDYQNVRSMHSIKPDVVVTFMNCVPALALFRGKIPVIDSERNCLDRNDQSFRDWYSRHLFYPLLTHIVLQTRHDKVFARWLHRKTVIPNPLSFIPLSYNEYVESFKERKNILACGRLDEPVKGFDGLICAFAMVIRNHPGWVLDIAGSGSDKNLEYLKSIASQNGVENSVRFLGHCRDVKQEMANHSIFVLSSKREGFPNVLTEAMAMGCACVAYDCVTGPGEIIVDSIDGLLVDNQNINEMAKSLSFLMDNPELRYKLGLRAIEDVKRFSPDKIVRKWEELFKSVIG